MITLLMLPGRFRLKTTIGMLLSMHSEAAVESMELAGAGVSYLRLDSSRGPFGTDPTRIVINVGKSGLVGHNLERILRYQHGVQIELSDSNNIVLLLSIGDTVESIEAFIQAFKAVIAGAAWAAGTGGPVGRFTGLLPPTPPMELSPAVAFQKPTHRVRLEEAVDLISGEMIASYPPGVPVVYPGERLTPAVVDYLLQARSAGVHLQGPEDRALEYLSVIDR